MQTIKLICNDLITPKTYKEDTKELTVKVYKEYGLSLSRVNGTNLLFGSSKIPKLMSVIRRIQLTKKAVEYKVKLASA